MLSGDTRSNAEARTLIRYLQKLKCRAGFLFILMLILISCGETEKMIVFEESELNRLLSGDSVKSWVRREIVVGGQAPGLSDCELYQLTRFDATLPDTLQYEIRQNPDFCEGDSSLLDQGQYSLFLDPVSGKGAIRMINNQDTLVKQVLEITSLYLRVQSTRDDVEVVERYEFLDL